MLLAFNFKEDFPDKESYIEDIIKDEIGKFTIVTPRNIQEWVKFVKNYRPRKTNHLILTNSHHTLLEDRGDAPWRISEWIFQAKGGSVWGETPTKKSLTFKGNLSDPAKILETGTYQAHRSLIFDSLSRAYIGRTECDPHTAIIGFSVAFPRIHNAVDFLVSGLPSQTGNSVEDEWWEGVSILDRKADGPLEKVVHWVQDSASVVTVGEIAHQRLVDLNIQHGALPEISKVFKSKTKNASSKFGVLLRETARTGEDNRKRRI